MENAQRMAKMGNADDLRADLDKERVRRITDINKLKTDIVTANNDKQQEINKNSEFSAECAKLKV